MFSAFGICECRFRMRKSTTFAAQVQAMSAAGCLWDVEDDFAEVFA